MTTVVAVSTPQGTGGIAVIRMSGPDSVEVLRKIWKGADPGGFESHTSHLGWITDSSGEEIDQVMAVCFRGQRSYTGEDVVEISCHGSLWIQRTIVDRLIEAGASPAPAGEFTRRAFLNGRLDLAQAEGVADMIVASSKAAARLAATQLKGEFSKRLESLRRQLVDLGVLLELELDFSEEDVEFADRARLIELAREIESVTSRLEVSFKAGKGFKNGVPVALAGAPNAGKSSLLNALVGDDKAIVSEIPGTTRDAIEDTVELDGILFRLTDTAGLRESDDEIEQIGVGRAFKKIEEASIVLFLIDPTRDVGPQLQMLEEIRLKTAGRVLILITKADLKGEFDSSYGAMAGGIQGKDALEISAKTGEGISRLEEILVKEATGEFNPQQEMIVTNARHYEALKRAGEPLRRLIEGLENGLSADFLAQDLREAESYLAEITGSISSEELLHNIFARYCIGK